LNEFYVTEKLNSFCKLLIYRSAVTLKYRLILAFDKLVNQIFAKAKKIY